MGYTILHLHSKATYNNEVRTEMASLRFDFIHSLDFFNLPVVDSRLYCICLYVLFTSCILIPHGFIQSGQRDDNTMFVTLSPSSSPFLTPIRMISPVCLLSYQRENWTIWGRINESKLYVLKSFFGGIISTHIYHWICWHTIILYTFSHS